MALDEEIYGIASASIGVLKVDGYIFPSSY